MRIFSFRACCMNVRSLTLGAHAQEGYGTCLVCVCVCVCVSVCTPAPTTLVSTLKMGYVGVYLRLFLLFMCGFSINPSVQKLWREKANMQMSSYRWRPVLARFEYRAYISRYLQAAH